MWILVGFAIIALLGLPLMAAIKSSTDLFVLDVKGGKVTVLRGRLPPRLLSDIEDIVRHPPIESARVRCVAENAKPRVLEDKGLPAGRLQQIRNVVGHFEITQIRTGRRRV